MQRDSVDRRRFIHIKFPFTVHVRPLDKQPIAAYSEDISQEGIKVTIKDELAIGSLTDLEVFIQAEPIKCKGKVVWVKKRDSKYIQDEIFTDTGIEFYDLSENNSALIKEHISAFSKTSGFIE